MIIQLTRAKEKKSHPAMAFWNLCRRSRIQEAEVTMETSIPLRSLKDGHSGLLNDCLVGFIPNVTDEQEEEQAFRGKNIAEFYHKQNRPTLPLKLVLNQIGVPNGATHMFILFSHDGTSFGRVFSIENATAAFPSDDIEYFRTDQKDQLFGTDQVTVMSMIDGNDVEFDWIIPFAWNGFAPGTTYRKQDWTWLSTISCDPTKPASLVAIDERNNLALLDMNTGDRTLLISTKSS